MPMPSRNRRLSATTDMSFGAWLGFLSTGRPRTGTSPAETPAVAGEQVVADAVGSRKASIYGAGNDGCVAGLDGSGVWRWPQASARDG